MRRELPVAAPVLVGREREYVLDCLDTTWISSPGAYIERFERGFAEFCGVQHAVACCNGTVALHLALLGLGVGPGDEVIVPSLTYVASANAVRYCGAEPVFVDSDPATWNLDPAELEEQDHAAHEGDRRRAPLRPSGGHGPGLGLAREHGLFVVEDAAEAHGAGYKGRRVGSLGDFSTFSFYGNKIITTGEGGMVLSDDDELAARLRLLQGQGQDPSAATGSRWSASTTG